LGFKDIPLGDTEKFIGVRSDTRGKDKAMHYDFQFVIGRPPTEIELHPPEKKKVTWIEALKKKYN
jgi:hypothetical protein